MAARIPIPLRLPRKFYVKPARILARQLLGKKLVRVDRGRRVSGIIVEVEAYLGAKDAAAHTFAGHRSARVESMYKEGGHAYVYFVYGMHFCFNVVAGKKDDAQAVLIRALEPAEGHAEMHRRRQTKRERDLTSGPAKLCQALKIKRSENGSDLVASKKLFIEDVGQKVSADQIVAGSRIGVDYAGKAAHWPLRFYIRGNAFVSKR